MWPEIPSDISSLSAADARDFARDIRLRVKEIVESDPSDDALAEVTEWTAIRDGLLSYAKSKDEADKKRAETLQALAAAVADDVEEQAEEVAPVVVEHSVVEDVEAPVEESVVETSPDVISEDVQPVAEVVPPSEVEVVASTPARVVTSVGIPVKEEPTGFSPSKLLARDGVSGKRPGEEFSSWTELSHAVMEKAKNVRTNTSEKFEVAYVPARFQENRKLTTDMRFNLRLFEQDEIMAEMCAPPVPLYDLACENTLRRPVAASLPAFQPDARGAVTVYPSPSLSDITTGYGQWTNDDDMDPYAVKEACQTIACAEPEEYRLYGVYRCLTVKNLLAMTFPELVEAYLNRLGAAHARLAETLLLEAMANGANTVTAPALGYNATTSITSTVLNYLALYQEQERWDVTGNMRAWMPRWVGQAIKMDMVRRKVDSGRASVPSDAEVAALFREVGVDVTFFIDTPSWATPVPSVETGGTLNAVPDQVEILIAPPNKFALMDRGELSIGVTGNNIYRDNTSNSRNEFTFFFENFEAVVDTNSCPADVLVIPDLCWNGAQIADVTINCDGSGD